MPVNQVLIHGLRSIVVVLHLLAAWLLASEANLLVIPVDDHASAAIADFDLAGINEADDLIDIVSMMRKSWFHD